MDTVNGSVFLALVLGLILAVPLTGSITGFFKRKVEKMIDSENDFREIVVDPELILNPVPFPGIQKLADPVSQPNSDIRSWRRYLHHIIPGLVVCFMIHYSSYPHDGTVVMMMVLYMFLCASFPLLFVIYVLKPSDSTYFGKALTIYFLAHILFIFYFLSRNPFSSAIWVLYIFILNIGPTLIFFLLNSRTTLRTITPFIFPVIFIGAIFLVLAFNLMISNQAILETVFNAFYGFFDALNIHGFTSFALFGSLLVLFAGIAIAVLVLFRLAYNSKTINSQILLIDCLWLTQIIYMTAMPYKDYRVLTYSLAIFTIYKAVQFIMMKIVNDNSDTQRQLLVLRVFSTGRENEKLFGYISSHWLSKGYIKLIAGYDLTNSLVDIDDLLIYLSGNIRKRFCLNAELISENVGKMDKHPDIDGRYRVNEMYCNNSTWKAVFDKLIPGTDRILMDLRGFSSKNKGCVHEIQQLIYSVPLETVRFVSDSKNSQEGSDMHTIMRLAWEKIPVTSPNYGNATTGFKVFEYHDKKDLPRLLLHLSAFA